MTRTPTDPLQVLPSRGSHYHRLYLLPDSTGATLCGHGPGPFIRRVPGINQRGGLDCQCKDERFPGHSPPGDARHRDREAEDIVIQLERFLVGETAQPTQFPDQPSPRPGFGRATRSAYFLPGAGQEENTTSRPSRSAHLSPDRGGVERAIRVHQEDLTRGVAVWSLQNYPTRVVEPRFCHRHRGESRRRDAEDSAAEPLLSALNTGLAISRTDESLPPQRFHFRTRKQELNSVEGSKASSPAPRPATSPGPLAETDNLGTRANLSYLDALAKFHKQQGTNMTRWPYVDKKPLDLYRLKKAVEARGGFEKVCKLKKWAEIGRDLGYSGKIMSSLSTSLKNSYQKWLCPYEDYLRIAKPGVHQQLELEYGGPLTPSPAPSPMKRSNLPTPASPRAETPTRHATDALQASIDGQARDSDHDVSMSDAPASNTPKPSSGFTAVNTGGFTAVNSGFTSVNRSAGAVTDSKGPVTPKTNGTQATPTKNTPEFRSSALGPSGLKRQMSCDSLDSAKKEPADQDDGDSGSRRSKRLKKGEFALPWLALGSSTDRPTRRYRAHCRRFPHVTFPLSRAQDTPGRNCGCWSGTSTVASRPIVVHANGRTAM